MWKILEQRYEKKGLPGQLYLKKNLLSMRLKEKESLEVFIQEYEEVVRQLKESGNEMKDQDLVCSILLSLPKSYETVVTVIENIPDVDFEIVKRKLLSEYEKRKLAGQENTVHGNSYTFSATNRGCFRCGEFGHYKRDCRKVLEQGTEQKGTYRGRGGARGRYNSRGQGRSRYHNFNPRSSPRCNHVQKNENQGTQEDETMKIVYVL